MTTSLEHRRPGTGHSSRRGTVTVDQLSPRGVLAVWVAAALPMAALSWIVVPSVADGTGPESLIKPLLVAMTAGLAWQFLLVVALVGHEQRSLRWSRVREALWLRSPRSPRTGRSGSRLWLLLIPLTVAFAIEELIALPAPLGRDFGAFLTSDAGHAMFQGAWEWFALVVTMSVFNTVLGEELLFRGFLLPRMQGAFGDRDWVVNGVLFATYHLHMPWAIPSAMLDTFLLSYPSRRYRSAWFGIAVHSTQSIAIIIAVLALVVVV